MPEKKLSDVMDHLTVIIADLGSIRRKMEDKDDRESVRSQIRALSKIWVKLDEEDDKRTDEIISDATSKLEEISSFLKSEKKNLQKIEKIIANAAKAIGIAERVYKMLS